MQKIFFGGSGGSGIVSTLIIAGIALKMLEIYPEWSTAAIGGGVCIRDPSRPSWRSWSFH